MKNIFLKIKIFLFLTFITGQVYCQTQYDFVDKILIDVRVGSFNYLGENNFADEFRGRGIRFINPKYDSVFFDMDENRLHLKGKVIVTNQTLLKPKFYFVVGKFKEESIENFKNRKKESIAVKFESIHLTPDYTFVSNDDGEFNVSIPINSEDLYMAIVYPDEEILTKDWLEFMITMTNAEIFKIGNLIK